MSTILAGDDHRLAWRGAVSIEKRASVEGSGFTCWPWRIDHEQRFRFAPNLARRAQAPSGVRIEFSTNSENICGRLEVDSSDSEQLAVIDLMVDGVFVESVTVRADGKFRFSSHTDEELAGEHHVHRTLSVLLPHDRPVGLCWIEIDESAEVGKATSAEFKDTWVFYGSSVEHGLHAKSPSRTWPSVFAGLTATEVVNVGFASEAQLDQPVASMLGRLSAKVIVVCVGINIHTEASMNLRCSRSALFGFIDSVRQRQPMTPLILVSPIISPDREGLVSGPRLLPRHVRRLMKPIVDRRPELFGPTLAELRDMVNEVADLLVSDGDQHLHLVDGRLLLGEADTALLRDGLHPTDDGFATMARRFVEISADLGLVL